MKSEERFGYKHIDYVFFYLEVCISSNNSQLCPVLKVILKKQKKNKNKESFFQRCFTLGQEVIWNIFCQVNKNKVTQKCYTVH